MSTQTSQAGGHSTVISYDNHLMTETAETPASWLRRALGAPFTRRAWAEVGYTVTSFLLAVAAVTFIVPMLENGIFWAISTTPVRKLGAGARFLARAPLGQDLPPPAPSRRGGDRGNEREAGERPHQLDRHPDARHGRLAGARLLPGQAAARGAGHER